MQTNISGKPQGLDLPFAARRKEIAQLHELHAQGRHVLLLGPGGVGKSALIGQLRQARPLLVCEQSSRLSNICDALEGQLDLTPSDQRLPQRKQRLLRAVAKAGRTVVFDGVGWTTPKLGAFLQGVSERVPVWMCTRSEHPWDIGHFWPLLARFARVELQPFRPTETRALIEAAVKLGLIPPEATRVIDWLYQRSGGIPLLLRELLEELATGQYDLSNPHALRRLDLDRRIREMFSAADPAVGTSAKNVSRRS